MELSTIIFIIIGNIMLIKLSITTLVKKVTIGFDIVQLTLNGKNFMLEFIDKYFFRFLHIASFEGVIKGNFGFNSFIMFFDLIMVFFIFFKVFFFMLRACDLAYQRNQKVFLFFTFGQNIYSFIVTTSPKKRMKSLLRFGSLTHFFKIMSGYEIPVN